MFALPLAQTTLPIVVAPAVSSIALVLLAAGGVSKILYPDPTRGAMDAARLPSSRLLSRALALAEIFSAAVGLVLGGPWLAPATLLYLGFAFFTWAAVRRRLPIQTCGCFGREDTPPTVLHVVFNVISFGALGYLILISGSAVPWEGTMVETALFLGFAMVGAYLSYLVLAQLPVTLQVPSTE